MFVSLQLINKQSRCNGYPWHNGGTIIASIYHQMSPFMPFYG